MVDEAEQQAGVLVANTENCSALRTVGKPVAVAVGVRGVDQKLLRLILGRGNQGRVAEEEEAQALAMESEECLNDKSGKFADVETKISDTTCGKCDCRGVFWTLKPKTIQIIF